MWACVFRKVVEWRCRTRNASAAGPWSSVLRVHSRQQPGAGAGGRGRGHRWRQNARAVQAIVPLVSVTSSARAKQVLSNFVSFSFLIHFDVFYFMQKILIKYGCCIL